jgi:hypothetical protein
MCAERTEEKESCERENASREVISHCHIRGNFSSITIWIIREWGILIHSAVWGVGGQQSGAAEWERERKRSNLQLHWNCTRYKFSSLFSSLLFSLSLVPVSLYKVEWHLKSLAMRLLFYSTSFMQKSQLLHPHIALRIWPSSLHSLLYYPWPWMNVLLSALSFRYTFAWCLRV